MKHTGLALLAAVMAAGAGFLLGRSYYAPAPEDDHRTMRQFMVYLTLQRVDDPIIVLGDSNAEASTLPRSACGHPIINAGLSGASLASELPGWLAPALANKPAFSIIVGLGTNDALASRPLAKQIFQSNYDAQLHELSKLTTRLFVLDIPPVEARGRFSPDTQQRIAATIRDYGSVLPELAAHNGARFLHLPDMAALSTIDGVHLSTEGYHIWETAIMEGVAQACGG